MDFDHDFDLITDEGHYSHMVKDPRDDLLDLPLFHSTPSFARCKPPPPPSRSFDFPSWKKYYGMLNFVDHQWPIIYRLIHDTLYIPYIRFSYALTIFEHPSFSEFLVNIRNLPMIEMTPTERAYYDLLSPVPTDADGSNYQLLSVSMLDASLAILNLAKDFNAKNDPPSVERCKEWRESLNQIREQARVRWILDETCLASRLSAYNSKTSTRLSSTTMAERRSFFEQRLDLSIVDEAGGFLQIDSFIYPVIKNDADDRLYINANDIRSNGLCPPFFPSELSFNDEHSSMSHAYSIVLEQAQSIFDWNTIEHGNKNELAKALPMCQRIDEDFSFVPLNTLLNFYSSRNSNLPFVQLFERSSVKEILADYKNHLARQFVLSAKRQGGFVQGHTPCLVSSQLNHSVLWTPNEAKTRRPMNNDERLFLNMILLYRGSWKYLLTKTKQWYLKETDHDQENFPVEIFSTHRR